MDPKQVFVEFLASTTPLSSDKIEELLGVPPDQKMGDLAFPCFTLAKTMKKAPMQIAQELAAAIKPSGSIQEVRAVGPYVNVFFNSAALAKDILGTINEQQNTYGHTQTKKETIMVEFFHANTHKAVHVGHVRTLSLGIAISKILEAVGKNVIRANYQGDIGPHVAKCIWGYLHAKDKPPKEHKGIWLGKKYAEGSQQAEKNKEIAADIAKINTQIYNQDPEVMEIWKKTRQWCLDDFEDFY